MEEIYKVYPHNPPHLFKPCAIYMITGATLYKRPLIDSESKKIYFCKILFQRIKKFSWSLEAWAVLPNHYHFIAQAPENAYNLRQFMQGLHSLAARFINHVDGIGGRRVWYNYWDSCITYEKSYLARLHYVHCNPVKHGIVTAPAEYPFCSYQWFVEHTDPEFQNIVFSQPCDKISVMDDF